MGVGRLVGLQSQSRRFCWIRGGRAGQTPALPNGFPAVPSLFGHEMMAFSACSMSLASLKQKPSSPGSTGGSSMSRPVVSITDPSEYWIVRSSRTMTVGGRHCEPTGRANARPMTGSAKQSIAAQELDCFVALLLAMTLRHNSAFSRRHSPEFCKFISPQKEEGAARP